METTSDSDCVAAWTVARSTAIMSAADAPFPAGQIWPRVSVIVCTYNGARTLKGCLSGLAGLAYPNFEVIVVNDGSTDDCAAIAGAFSCRLITTPNRGLSSARNTGLEAASGEIVAYIDDDAFPDPHWLQYLVATFLATPHAGVGGPNLGPPGDGTIAECVLNAPGGPLHVLTSDRVIYREGVIAKKGIEIPLEPVRIHIPMGLDVPLDLPKGLDSTNTTMFMQQVAQHMERLRQPAADQLDQSISALEQAMNASPPAVVANNKVAK